MIPHNICDKLVVTNFLEFLRLLSAHHTSYLGPNTPLPAQNICFHHALNRTTLLHFVSMFQLKLNSINYQCWLWIKHYAHHSANARMSCPFENPDSLQS